MRTKDEILKESKDQAGNVPSFDATASLHERLTIEVWIDIRDVLYSSLDRDQETFFMKWNKG